MLVCVTGGTGFLGAHTVSAVVRAGHRVRLLVRDPARIEPALGPLGVESGAVDVVVGDVTHEPAVALATRGADAVLHLAAGRERVLRADSPVARPRDAYLATKAAAETVARDHQRADAPVVITYPSALLGPHDPRLGDQNARLRNALRGLMPMWSSGGFPVGDVRDTAAMHAGLLTGSPSGRCFGPGHYVSTREYLDTLRAVTGRGLPAVFLPAKAMLPMGLLTGVVQHVWPWHIPAEYGAIYTCDRAARVADDADTSGVRPRPIGDTIRDTVSWLRRTGWLSERLAGALPPMPAVAR